MKQLSGMNMRNLWVLVWLFTASQAGGQIIFEEDFQSFSAGLDLTSEGFALSQHPNYTGTVTALVTESDTNKFARMAASPNGAAGMQIVKTIDVQAWNIYSYEVDSRGPFKRQLRIYSENDELLSSSADYKPSTEAEGAKWKKLEVTFLAPKEATQVKIGFHHYWSGTIDLDNYKVTKEGEANQQTAYYVSSSTGDDAHAGTKEAPWKSLEKISETFLFPGDSVLFKRGDTLHGHFVVTGSGTEEEAILISSYGEGAKPLITGQVGVEGGGDFQEAILIENKDNLVLDGLEVQNERLASRTGVADTDAYGISVRNSGDRVMQNLVFRNMTFKNVFAVEPILDPEDFNSIQVSGLRFYSSRNTEAGKEKHIRDILIEDCYFANLQRFGIQFQHGGASAGIGNDSLNRNMNILVQNNEFYYNGGTGVLPNGTYNCLIENNLFDHPGASTDPRMPGRGSSIWNINSINTIMQYNMCLSTRGYLDSYGIHIDNSNVNTFVQYNYMEDCEGGFVEILKSNKNAVYRFNVSVNDGWRKNPTWANSNMTIWMASARWSNDDGNLELSDSSFVYNNTVIINQAFTTAISMDARNIFIYNNIFSSTNGSGMGRQQSIVRDNDTPFFMSNNLFEGNVDNRFVAMDAKPQLGSPLFKDTGEQNNAYELQAGSPAMDQGTPLRGPVVKGAGYGVFKDVPAYPDVDFYGNPIDLSSGTPNIGAANNKELLDTTALTEFVDEERHWMIYPRLSNSKIHIISLSPFSGPVQVSLINLKGQVILSEKTNISPSDNAFDLFLNASVKNGIYVLNIQGEGLFHSRRLVLYP